MIRKFWAAAAAWALAATAYGMDGVALELGSGEEQIKAIRLAATWDWKKRDLGYGWRLAGYWEASIGAWENAEDAAADFALTPVFRLERHLWYLEAAIGVHVLSQHVSASDQFSRNLEFGEHLALGVRFGDGRRYDLGLRLQHISNGGIYASNPGFNFLLLRFQYHLD